jgi:hypothetical protein
LGDRPRPAFNYHAQTRYLAIWFSRIGYGDGLRLGAKSSPFYYYLVFWFWLASYLVNQQSGYLANQIAEFL